MQGLMRIKFTPDFNKLIICTTGGYMLMVHNLSLLDLPKDLRGFKVSKDYHPHHHHHHQYFIILNLL